MSEMNSTNFIPLSMPNISGNERKYVDEAIDTTWVSTGGAFISRFEESIADYLKVDSAVACQSGTAGLHLAMVALGIEPGDEVLVPTLTFVAAVNPVRYIGAEPVFIDCDDTLCIDAKKVRQFCENECDFDGEKLIDKATGKPVSAIVAVHVFGNLADLEELVDIANTYHLRIIEDATEALGSYYQSDQYSGKFAGTIGDIGVYSFNGNKIITTGGGGMIVARDAKVLEHCRHLSTQAKEDPLYFIHDEIGFNYRMTNLQAALGLAQLERLEEFVTAKESNYERYIENDVKLLPFREDIRSNKWFYSYMTDGVKERDRLIQWMDANKVQCRPVWALIHTLKPYEGSRNYQIEKAVYYHDKIVNIPCSTNLSESDVNRVSALIHEFEQGAG